MRTPEEYRARAERVRKLAGAKDPSTAKSFRQIAADYDQMAETAEDLRRRKAGRKKGTIIA